MTDVTDNFNRANGALGTNWSAGPSFTAPTIVSNVGSSAADSAWHVAHWNTSVNTFSNDQYSEATVLDGSTVTTFAGAIVRHQPSTSSGYLAFPNGGSIKLYRLDSGSFNLLNTIGSGVIDGSVIRLEITGTTLNVKVNGTSAGTFTDATYASGSPGIASFSSGRLDSWTGGPITVTGPPPPTAGTKTVRVIANANLKNLPTVNVVTSRVNEPVWSQSATGGPANQTVQVGGNVSGLKRVYISGYTGPI